MITAQELERLRVFVQHMSGPIECAKHLLPIAGCGCLMCIVDRIPTDVDVTTFGTLEYTMQRPFAWRVP